MIKVLTYNIHKGFDRYNRDFVLHKMRDQLRDAEVDVVLLQEIQGRHYRHETGISTWPEVTQFEFLADSIWPHYAYGKNAIYEKGHHGNAILSKFIIIKDRASTCRANPDISGIKQQGSVLPGFSG